MKAVVMAGGKGTRLYPLTEAINKHFLPIYNKPMIYYSLSLPMLAGIRDVALIVNTKDLELYRNFLGNGENFGISITYIEQGEPKGIAEGIILSESFLGNDNFMFILGDNFLFGRGLKQLLTEIKEKINDVGGAFIFAYKVKDPQRFGVVVLDKNFKPIHLEEKPQNPKSNFAVTGIYFFDNKAIEFAKSIKPSKRGELEITSVLEKYLEIGELKVKVLGRGYAWFDMGTYESFLEAGNFVATIENKTGLMIGNLEEIAYFNGWIDKDELLRRAVKLKKTTYGKYLFDLINDN